MRTKLPILTTAMLCGVLSAVISCSPSCESRHKEIRPNDPDGFVTMLTERFDSITQLGQTDPEQIKDMTRRAHVALYKSYPFYYDWWLQDGESVEWFAGSMASHVAERMARHSLALTDSSAAGLRSSIGLYIEACQKRRGERLARFTATNPQIAFTKFEPLRPSFFAYTEGLSDARAECNFFPGGQLGLLTMNGMWADEETLIDDSLGVIRDPDVHFDGKHLLFSWKKSAKEDDFHLYEMEFPSRTITQLTSGLGYADIEPIYLPDENILFNSTRNGSSVDCWTVEVSNLYLCDRAGRYMRQVGFDQVHTSNPTLLDDGRVVYTRWDYNDRGQVFTQPLFQMNPDGTAQAAYYGMNSFFPTTLTHAAQIPGTRKIMATIMGHHTPQHGKLCVVDPEAGREENEGVMFVAPILKPKAERIDSYGQYTDQFQHPCPLNEDEFLVSYTPLGYYTRRPLLFGIYWMQPDGQRELLTTDSTVACSQPKLLAARERPFRRASSVDYTQQQGSYYMQNIYEGMSMEGVERGTIKKLRIVEPVFRPASVGIAYGAGEGGSAHAFSPVGVGNASWDIKHVLGTVDVNEDGSAMFTAPSRVPLYFQALDENGRVVQTMRSWSSLQPGEAQSCVGCHEHKNTVPLSAHPVSMAMNNTMQQIAPEGAGDRAFSYIKEVQPIWDANCVSCHNGTKHSMSLRGDLKVVDSQTKRQYSDSYLNLTHARQSTSWNASWQGDAGHKEVNWISSLSEPTMLRPYFAGSNTSNLIRRLESEHKGVRLTPDQIATVALWIDLCVPFIDDYRQANAWTPEEHEYYTYYDTKREQARRTDRENIRQYIESLNKK